MNPTKIEILFPCSHLSIKPPPVPMPSSTCVRASWTDHRPWRHDHQGLTLDGPWTGLRRMYSLVACGNIISLGVARFLATAAASNRPRASHYFCPRFFFTFPAFVFVFCILRRLRYPSRMKTARHLLGSAIHHTTATRQARKKNYKLLFVSLLASWIPLDARRSTRTRMTPRIADKIPTATAACIEHHSPGYLSPAFFPVAVLGAL